MKSLATIFDAIASWQRETFGTGQSVAGLIKHIRSELVEIEAAPDDVEEAADLFFFVVQLASRFASADGERFAAAVLAKLEKNRQRKWPARGTVDADRPIEHLRKEGES